MPSWTEVSQLRWDPILPKETTKVVVKVDLPHCKIGREEAKHSEV